MPVLQNGAVTEQGKVLVADHIPKVKVWPSHLPCYSGITCPNIFQHAISQCCMQDFFQKDCWRHHPKPHADYMEMKQKQDEEFAASKKKLIPGMA